MTLPNVLIFGFEHLSQLSLNYNESIIKNLLEFAEYIQFCGRNSMNIFLNSNTLQLETKVNA